MRQSGIDGLTSLDVQGCFDAAPRNRRVLLEEVLSPQRKNPCGNSETVPIHCGYSGKQVRDVRLILTEVGLSTPNVSRRPSQLFPASRTSSSAAWAPSDKASLRRILRSAYSSTASPWARFTALSPICSIWNRSKFCAARKVPCLDATSPAVRSCCARSVQQKSSKAACARRGSYSRVTRPTLSGQSRRMGWQIACTQRQTTLDNRLLA